MKNFILLSSLIASACFFQGCASVLTLKDGEINAVIQNKEIANCTTEKRKIIWNQVVMGQLYSKDSDSKLTKYEQIESSSIFSHLDKLSDKSCATPINIIAEISNTPTDESRGLILLNIISLGIIPYWDQFENKIKVDVYRNGDLINTYTSTVPYTRMQSIFLWLKAPFAVTSEHELNLKTIPMHFNNISEEIHKSAGLK